MVEISLPDSLEIIPDEALRDCKNLKRVLLPKNLSRIGKRALQDCGSLESLFVPAMVQSIGGGAFADCRNLKLIDLPIQFLNFSPVTGLGLPDRYRLLDVRPG